MREPCESIGALGETVHAWRMLMSSFSGGLHSTCMNAPARPVLCSIVALCLAFASSHSTAQEKRTVELRALDGSAVVNGELVEVNDDSYVVETDLGILQIAVDDAECLGEACPKPGQSDRALLVDGPIDDVEPSIPALLRDYARNIGSDYQIDETESGTQEVSILGDEKRTLLAEIDLRAVDAHGASTNDVPARRAGPHDVQVFAEQNIPSTEANKHKLLLALDGIAVVVHPDNPVSNLSTEIIAQLFACDRTDWQSFGVSAGPVRLYVRNAQSDAHDAFSSLVLDPHDVELCDTATHVDSDAELADIVTNDPNAIGFLSLGNTYDTKPIAIGECSTLAHKPSAFGVKAEEYPLARRVFIAAPSVDPSVAARNFIDFALSDSGQKQLQETRFVDLTIDTTRNYTTD